jgi:hypothetical protein
MVGALASLSRQLNRQKERVWGVRFRPTHFA